MKSGKQKAIAAILDFLYFASGNVRDDNLYAVHDGEKIDYDTLSSSLEIAKDRKRHTWWESHPNARVVKIVLKVEELK